MCKVKQVIRKVKKDKKLKQQVQENNLPAVKQNEKEKKLQPFKFTRPQTLVSLEEIECCQTKMYIAIHKLNVLIFENSISAIENNFGVEKKKKVPI